MESSHCLPFLHLCDAKSGGKSCHWWQKLPLVGSAKRGEFGVNCFVSNCHHSPRLPNILIIIRLYHPPFASSSVCIIFIFKRTMLLIIAFLILKLVNQLQRNRFKNSKSKRQLNSFSENSSILDGQVFL